MAALRGKDDDYRKIRERREEEDRQEEAERASRGESSPKPGAQATAQAVDAILGQIDPIVDQISNLYQMYLSGIERLPPIEKRKLLDGHLAQLYSASKSGTASQFRIQAATTKIRTHIDRWDRLMRDLESGKIARRTKPTK